MLKRFDEMHEEIVCSQREGFSKKMTSQGVGPGPLVSSLELAQVRSLHEILEYAEEASVRDRLGFPGRVKLPPSFDPSKSEGWWGSYSLSVWGRTERKEGFLR
jgi:hypothetical protein